MAPTYILEAADLQLPHHHDKPCVSIINKISRNRNHLCFVQADNRGGLPDQGGHGAGGCGGRAAPHLQAHHPLDVKYWVDLLVLNFNVQNEEILDRNKQSENKHLSENFCEMIAKFVKIGEILKSTAKNKFKKVAENELNNLCEEICKVEIDKLSKLQGLFGES